MFDPKCLELAEYFLPAGISERAKAGMAQAIQDAVEDYAVGEVVNLTHALQQPRVEVYSRPECVFQYCSNPEFCKSGGKCYAPR